MELRMLVGREGCQRCYEKVCVNISVFINI